MSGPHEAPVDEVTPLCRRWTGISQRGLPELYTRTEKMMDNSKLNLP